MINDGDITWYNLFMMLIFLDESFFSQYKSGYQGLIVVGHELVCIPSADGYLSSVGHGLSI